MSNLSTVFTIPQKDLKPNSTEPCPKGLTKSGQKSLAQNLLSCASYWENDLSSDKSDSSGDVLSDILSKICSSTTTPTSKNLMLRSELELYPKNLSDLDPKKNVGDEVQWFCHKELGLSIGSKNCMV